MFGLSRGGWRSSSKEDAPMTASLSGTRSTAAPARSPGKMDRTPSKADGSDTAVKVIVRCRPALRGGDALSIQAEAISSDKMSVKLELPNDSSPTGSGSPPASRRLGRSFRCNKYLGPEASQSDVFEHAQSLVDWIMEGYNGTIFCYGITGTGKSYTMVGPSAAEGSGSAASDSLGVAQRISRQVFEYIRDRSSRGEVFMVEASSLLIFSEDGVKERLVDLLAAEVAGSSAPKPSARPGGRSAAASPASSAAPRLEVRQDPDNPSTYVCDGLRKLPIRSPDEMIEVLQSSQRKADSLEKAGVCRLARAHSVFMLEVESLAESSAASAAGESVPGNDAVVKRGKLMLVDLAGSESLKIAKTDDSKEQLLQRQTMHINRTLSALGALVTSTLSGKSDVAATPPSKADSAVVTLMQDCLGGSGSARGILLATISTELESYEDTTKTLTFAQQMTTVRHQAHAHRIKQEHSSLLQMKSRHAACIRMLQEKAMDTSEKENEERRKLQSEMEELNQRLVTQEKAEKSLEQMKVEQLQKIDEMRNEMSRTMSLELERMRTQTLQDLASLAQSVEQHVTKLDDTSSQRHAEEHDMKMQKMQQEVQAAFAAQRGAEDEVADLRVRLASAEERAKMLNARQEELRRDKMEFEEERIRLRHQNEQQHQKLTAVEGELQKFKTEGEVQQTELNKLHSVQATDLETIRRDRSEWQAKEASLQQDISKLQKELEDTRREGEVQALRLESEKKEASTALKLQIQQLELEGATRAAQLEKLRQSLAEKEMERETVKQREAELRMTADMDHRKYAAELEEMKAREQELMNMLHEVQESIIHATQGKVRM